MKKKNNDMMIINDDVSLAAQDNVMLPNIYNTCQYGPQSKNLQ